MDLQISGKRALVTGSTAGIGLAIATALAREGARVTVNGRTAARVDEAVAQVKRDAAGGVVEGIVADLGTAEGARRVIGAMPDVDLLINNLGIYEVKPFEQLSDEDWMHILEVNLISGVRLSRHYFPPMLKRGWGRVIFISSESGVQIPTEMIHYGVTKSAQVSLARGMAELTAGTGVTVNSVLVGPTKSEGVEQFVADMAHSRGVTEKEVEADFFKSVRPSSLIKRFETSEEVAAVVAFLCGAVASGINGSAVRAEGGVLKGML
ncbi:MAG: dehydrogenase, short-chain alcohol dehydrogenase like protein [Phycisphaerales bacterium]|nr:dehydrogenase, short-chain alcohol dehydrogenase like protein [Phycisphaerales bacterium]